MHKTLLSILFTHLFMLLAINWEWRPTILGTAWVKRRRQSAPWIAYSQNGQDSWKLGKGDKTQKSTAANATVLSQPRFHWGQECDKWKGKKKQRREREKEGVGRQESGTIQRGPSMWDHQWRGVDEVGITANSCLAPASQNCRKTLSVSMRLKSRCLGLLA